MNWFENAVFYHIYPIGYFGCPRQNDFTSEPTHKILRVIDDIPHIKELGCSAVYFGPVFESSAHGYDTADYTRIDRRLGTNEDFKKVCDALHENGIRVVLDGVFNHVGRDFWAFRDVRENKLGSARKDWFHVREGNDGYNDGFWYEGWEGHYELVKLNLYNPEVKQYLKDCITGWKNEFGIDGLRLDVAYCLDLNFLKELHGHCKWLSEDFFLLGETLHGDYNKWMNPEMLDSVTNYECYKGLFSSFNELGGANGIGLVDLVENRLVGMKSRGVYETPGGTILYHAHEALETLCLDRDTQHYKQQVAIKFAELVYYGQWYTPLRQALTAFVDTTQQTVTGEVKLKLYKGNIINAGMTSPYSLYSEEIATFGEDNVYDQTDSQGFINLFGLPIKVKALLDEKRKH